MNNVVRFGALALIALGVLAMLMKLVLGERIEMVTFDTGAMLLAAGFVTLALSALASAVESLRAIVAGEGQEVGFFEDNSSPSPSYPQEVGASSALVQTRGNSQGLSTRQEPEMPSHGFDRSKSPEERSSVVKDHPHPTIETAAEEVHDFDAAPPVSDEAISEEELYVVEERTIAGKPARVLSDGTVEAETDEGWMRFENIEHLEEYMEAVRAERG